MFRRPITCLLAFIFLAASVVTPSGARAEELLGLPVPGAMVSLSPAYQPLMIKGMTIHKDNPFLFDFILDAGQENLPEETFKKEGDRLIKYFMASLAMPAKDLWVNLSPYEKDRTIPEALARTDMGRDLLAQDYLLKQLTASMIYPDKELGKAFWDRVYAKAQQLYGTSNVPVDTFNKVWIMADKAEVFERNNTVFVTGVHLKVLLEEDYLALSQHNAVSQAPAQSNTIASQIVRDIVLPELEKEVNAGKNFAPLRQIVHSLILASWYKDNLQQALLNEVYANKEKVDGIDLQDKDIKAKIYNRYLEAYKKGVFNFVREDRDPAQSQMIPRKYFSGGWDPAAAAHPTVTRDQAQLAQAIGQAGKLMVLSTGFVNAVPVQATPPVDKAMLAPGDYVLRVGGQQAKMDYLRTLKNKELMTLAQILMEEWGNPEVLAAMASMELLEKSILLVTDELVRRDTNVLVIGEESATLARGLRILKYKAVSRKYVRTPKGKSALDYLSGNPVDAIIIQVDTEIPSAAWKIDIADIKAFAQKKGVPIIIQDPAYEEGTGAANDDVEEGIYDVPPGLSAEELDILLLTAEDPSRKHTGMVQLKGDRDVILGKINNVLHSSMTYPPIGIKPGATSRTVKFLDQNASLKMDYDSQSQLTRAVFTYGRSSLTVFFNEYPILKSPSVILNTMRSVYLHQVNGEKDGAMMAQPKPAAVEPVSEPQSTDSYGGIDLNTAGVKWNIRKDGQGVEINIDPAMAERIRQQGVQGLSPVIFRITPIQSVWPLLGLQQPQEAASAS